jgi:hypothetical protein
MYFKMTLAVTQAVDRDLAAIEVTSVRTLVEPNEGVLQIGQAYDDCLPAFKTWQTKQGIGLTEAFPIPSNTMSFELCRDAGS